jgi:RNA polymerase sigma factor for flagellar operon FliA
MSKRLPLDFDEALSVADEALVHAVDSFDPARGACFKTWLAIKIRGALLDEVRANDVVTRRERELGVTRQAPVSLDESPLELVDQLDEISQRELANDLDVAIATLPERERQVVVLRAYEDLTLKTIGEALGVGESRASQLWTKGLERMRDSGLVAA